MRKAEESPKSGKTVFIRSYGCQMNVYDSQRMAELLKPHGYLSVETPDDADLVILNTCHIREKAAEKVFSDLGRLRSLKDAGRSSGRDMTVAVAGCVAQAEGGEIQRRMSLVDIVVGPQSYHRLPELLARRARAAGAIVDTDFAAEEKFDVLAAAREAPGPAAFLTIQEGCDKFCTFCVVPYTRGAEISRPAAPITQEARDLVAKGAREITLLGQNVNAWRSEPAPDARGIRAKKDGSWGLGQLCRHLAAIDGLERIRFTTSHPRDMDDDLIDAFATVPKLMPFLHLPVQSGSDRILDAMNRGHTAAHYVSLIEGLRAVRPDLAVSGDFIVGFPSETTGDFEETLALVERVGYASAYCFKYSRRPGTPGASMGRQVAEGEKEERLARLLTLVESQRQAFNSGFIGKDLPVLFEKPGRRDGQLIGRSPYLQSVHAAVPQSMLGKIAATRIVSANATALAGDASAAIEGTI